MVSPTKPRAPLDPSLGFIAPKNMRFNGRAVLAGKQLDTDGIPDRKLAQLYASRVIDQPNPEAPAAQPDPLSEVDQARADRLEAAHNRKALDQLGKTAGITNPSSFGSKGALAEAIVRLDPEAGKPEPANEDEGEIVAGSAVVVTDETSEHNGKSAEVVSIADDGVTAAIKLADGGEAIEAITLESLKLPEAPPAEGAGSGE